jgi:RNA-directed DNA polymerase
VVVETDIVNCFSAIPHEKLIQAVEERICDQSLLKLLRGILRAGVMEEGQVRRMDIGTPQGGVISPLLSNVYLHRLDRAWDEQDGILVRFADDLIALCWSRSQADRALARLTALLVELGLEPKLAKTRIVHLEVGGKGLDFLGFHHRMVKSPGRQGKRPVVFLARWPADKAMRHARDRIRYLTDRRRQLRPETIAEELNLFLRGWTAYFRYGHSARRFSKIRTYAWTRLAHYISDRHGRARGFGSWVLSDWRVNDLGLISMSGIVIPPRPSRTGG